MIIEINQYNLKDMMLRIEEAIARAKANGKKMLKKDIAAKLWPHSDESAQQVNMTKLCSGKTKSIRPEWVVILCEMTDCTSDFLFGLKNE